jgi:cation transport regulator ChaC
VAAADNICSFFAISVFNYGSFLWQLPVIFVDFLPFLFLIMKFSMAAADNICGFFAIFVFNHGSFLWQQPIHPALYG